MAKELILAKYGEMALKGLNRGTFEDILMKNLRRRLKKFGAFKLNRAQSTIYMEPLSEDIDLDEVLELVGHPVGGVCPFGCKEGIPVYLDVSLQRFETVFPAVGSPSSAIELNLDELYKYSNALEWIDVCKLPAPAEA